MTNKDKVLALIGTFATGDTEKAKELLAEDYIQHNLAYGTGADICRCCRISCICTG